MNFGNIKLPPPKYDCKIHHYGKSIIEITFYREVDTGIVSDLLSLKKDAINISDNRNLLGYFSINDSPYDPKELAESIATHLEEKHNLRVLRSGF